MFNRTGLRASRSRELIDNLCNDLIRDIASICGQFVDGDEDQLINLSTLELCSVLQQYNDIATIVANSPELLENMVARMEKIIKPAGELFHFEEDAALRRRVVSPELHAVYSGEAILNICQQNVVFRNSFLARAQGRVDQNIVTQIQDLNVQTYVPGGLTL